MTKTLASIAFSALALLPQAVDAAESFRVLVHGGGHSRADTPVSVDLPIAARGVTSVEVTGALGGVGQIESLGASRSRVHWVLSKLEARAKVAAAITVSRDGAAASGYAWKEAGKSEDGEFTDLTFGDRPVLRYMQTPFDKKNIELTKKVFHHVWTPDGTRRMTKGHGGLFPHHRGIYFGYSKIRIGDAKQTIDTWHGKNGEHQAHGEVLSKIEGPVAGGHVVRVDWNDRQGKTFIKETRRIVVIRQSDNSHLVDFQSRLEAVHSNVRLDGDPQHSGVQFRASQYVAENQKATRYLRAENWMHHPEDKQVNWPQDKKHVEMPWNAVRFGLPDGEGKVERYTVAYMSHPSNPGEGRTSERLYGRFGEYFEFDLSKDRPLEVHYRWWISSSDKTSREQVQARYDDLAFPPKVELLK